MFDHAASTSNIVRKGHGSNIELLDHPSPERRVSSEESAAAMSSSKAPEVFKPTAVLYVAMSMMAILTLVVALDVTALAVALPVRYLTPMMTVTC